MPQLSLYIDSLTLKKLEIAAKIEQLSISKFAVKKLNESLNAEWPDNYGELYGAIKDNSFIINQTSSFKNDTKREEL